MLWCDPPAKRVGREHWDAYLRAICRFTYSRPDASRFAMGESTSCSLQVVCDAVITAVLNLPFLAAEDGQRTELASVHVTRAGALVFIVTSNQTQSQRCRPASQSSRYHKQREGVCSPRCHHQACFQESLHRPHCLHPPLNCSHHHRYRAGWLRSLRPPRKHRSRVLSST